MTRIRWPALILWLIGTAAASWIVVHAQYVNDLSAFLPAQPSPLQRLLVEQLRAGPGSRLILIALAGGSESERASMSRDMVLRLRGEPEFSRVDNGTAADAERDRRFLFQHRYLLSDAVTAERFTAPGLESAIRDTLLELSSTGGLLLKSLVPNDPTGETLRIVEHLAQFASPRLKDGVWVSGDGVRTLLVAQAAAAGSDTDAQERALQLIRNAFAAAPHTPAVTLTVTGPAVFAVAARAHIKQAATRLSMLSSALVIAVLLTVYRSAAALLLSLLPVVTGALAGIAAVALLYGEVHGVTLGFGATLIGEAVDYSVYFFVQGQRSAADWQRRFWPTVRLGMMTSVCGFASLLPSGFPGLSQLGVYSISGLVAAALVTRFVLPIILPRGLQIRNLQPLGVRLAGLRNSLPRCVAGRVVQGGLLIAAAALIVLIRQHATLWNHELSALSPISPRDLAIDATLRADLGAPTGLALVVVEDTTLDGALRGAEQSVAALQPLIAAGVIGHIDSPADFLPSLFTQQARRAALPDTTRLTAALGSALEGLDLEPGALAPFVTDVAAARRAPLLQPADLMGTSFAAGFEALTMHESGHWSALLPLHAAAKPSAGAPDIDTAKIAAALADAHLAHAQVLDLKQQSDALYGDYLREAVRLSLGGVGLIVVLLAVALRSASQVVRVLAPLALAVLTVAAALVLAHQQLTILHLVGMLLIVAVGSNYALFFVAQTGGGHRDAALTLVSLGIANLCTVIAFGMLSFSAVPVLVALGTTVAPGALLALVYAWLIMAP